MKLGKEILLSKVSTITIGDHRIINRNSEFTLLIFSLEVS